MLALFDALLNRYGPNDVAWATCLGLSQDVVDEFLLLVTAVVSLSRVPSYAVLPAQPPCSGGNTERYHVLSMNVVSTLPSMKAEWRKIFFANGIVVLMPSITNSSKARRMVASASSRVERCTMSLPISES